MSKVVCRRHGAHCVHIGKIVIASEFCGIIIKPQGTVYATVYAKPQCIQQDLAGALATVLSHFSRTGRLCTPAEIEAETPPQTLVKP